MFNEQLDRCCLCVSSLEDLLSRHVGATESILAALEQTRRENGDLRKLQSREEDILHELTRYKQKAFWLEEKVVRIVIAAVVQTCSLRSCRWMGWRWMYMLSSSPMGSWTCVKTLAFIGCSRRRAMVRTSRRGLLLPLSGLR
eukprot:763944-Hanusia_phi.AAC.2